VALGGPMGLMMEALDTVDPSFGEVAEACVEGLREVRKQALAWRGEMTKAAAEGADKERLQSLKRRLSDNDEWGAELVKILLRCDPRNRAVRELLAADLGPGAEAAERAWAAKMAVAAAPELPGLAAALEEMIARDEGEALGRALEVAAGLAELPSGVVRAFEDRVARDPGLAEDLVPNWALILRVRTEP
jgi:hypothetical protein